MVTESKCETCKNCKRYGGTSQITRQNWNCDIGADIIYALVRGGVKTKYYYWCQGVRWESRYKERDVIVCTLEFNKKSVETDIKYAENASDNEINSKNIRDFNKGIAFASRDE